MSYKILITFIYIYVCVSMWMQQVKFWTSSLDHRQTKLPSTPLYLGCWVSSTSQLKLLPNRQGSAEKHSSEAYDLKLLIKGIENSVTMNKTGQSPA